MKTASLWGGTVVAGCLLAGILSCKNSIDDSLKSSAVDKKSTAKNSMAAAAQSYITRTVFNGGDEGGYHSFRIPSIIKTKNGTLIAFAEGRKNSSSDWGDIDLVFKRSTDNGLSWGTLGTVVSTGADVWGNPTAVYDPAQGTSGRIWLFMSWNSGTKTAISQIAHGERKTYTTYSDDNGATWTTPVDRTAQLLPATFTWDAMGPGVGIVTAINSPGRLIIPAKGRNIYSDDHGATWAYQRINDGTDEGTVVETMDGKWLRNDRPGSTLWEQNKRRLLSRGSIGGTYTAFAPNETLLDPKCEGSMLRYNIDSPHRIFFLNPASTERRCKMRVRISYDDGASWSVSRRLRDDLSEDETCNQGIGGYSSMIKTADYNVAALVEKNEDVSSSSTSHKSIELHKFNLSWILNGVAEP